MSERAAPGAKSFGSRGYPANAILLASLLASCNARAEWFVDATLGADYDSNVPRAQRNSDIEEDGALTLEVAPGYHFQLTDRVGLALSARLGGTKVFDFDGLDNVSAGGAAALRVKLGVGAQAPWVRASVTIVHDDYDHALRDAWRRTASVSAGLRVGERWSWQLGYFHEHRRADHIEDIPFLVDFFGIGGEAWDIDAHNVTASGIFDINGNWSLLFGFTRRMGEVTSTTRIGPEIFEASDAIAPDEVFGADRFAYRIDADTNIFSIGLSRAVGDHVSINVGYEYQDSDAYEELNYANHIGHVSLQFSY
ncbi:MAG: hypothetical protein HYY48_10305 [Gammaproteobacteria bacterium]|nr:hypothetical protein [Gammaproteobacteria bacterium]